MLRVGRSIGAFAYPKLHLLYVAFREDEPEVQSLVEVVFDQIMNYALPRRKYFAALERLKADEDDGSIMSELQREAKDAFIKYKTSKSDELQPAGGLTDESINTDDKKDGENTRYTEIGEVIAFCVANHFLNAGQVAAKMALKTNSEMPVFGVDGIHIRIESNQTVTVFYLESKMVGDARSGTSQYLASATGFYADKRQRKNEDRIIRDLSNFDILEADARQVAIEYFNPYGESRGNVRERFVGVILYDESLYGEKSPLDDNDIGKHEREFVDKYKEVRVGLKKSFETKLDNKDASDVRFRVFYVAVPSVDKLKELFSEVMGK